MKKEYYLFLWISLVLSLPNEGRACIGVSPGTLVTLLHSSQAPTTGKSKSQSIITYSLTPGTHNTWGYIIYVNNKASIVQPTPPGMSGNEGFKTKAGAESVAKLVVQKMKKGEMPPSVSMDEMKKLKAI